MLDLLNKLRREAQILNDYNNETFNVRVTTYQTKDNEMFIVVMQHGEITLRCFAKWRNKSTKI